VAETGRIDNRETTGITTIDEVKAMTRAADSVGESVKTGLLGLRKRAVEAGKTGAEVTTRAAQAAEQLLAENTEEARKEAAKRGRKARKELAAKSGQTRKELAHASKQARKEAAERLAELRKPGRKARKAAIQAAKSAGDSKRKARRDFKAAKKDFKAAVVEAKSAAKGEHKRRRWPWLLGAGLVAAGAAYALRPKPEPPVATEPPRATPKPAESKPTTNGQAAAPSPAQKKN
jgi:hypothetical protein